MSNFERYDEPVATNESHNLNINPDVFRQAGTMEVNTHNDGEVRNMQQRVDAHELPSPYGGDILSTLKTPQGSPILTQDRMSDSCIVTVNGMEMSVSQAKGLGFIQADAGGNLSETGRTAEDLNASETPSIELRDFSGESKEVMDSLTAGVGERTMHELTNSIIAGITSEDYNGKAVAPEIGLEKAVKSFTNLTGVDPEHAEKAVKVIINSHVDQASNFITRNYKIDGQQVIDWASENLNSTAKADVYRRVMLGDQTVLAELVDRYGRRSKY